MENGVFGKIQITIDTKWARILKRNCKYILFKINQYKIQRLNFVVGHLISKLLK